MGVNFTAGRGRAWEGGRAPKFGILEAGNSVLVNGVRGTHDIEGKATRVEVSECGQRTSFKTEAKPFTRVLFRLILVLIASGRAEL